MKHNFIIRFCTVLLVVALLVSTFVPASASAGTSQTTRTFSWFYYLERLFFNSFNEFYGSVSVPNSFSYFMDINGKVTGPSATFTGISSVHMYPLGDRLINIGSLINTSTMACEFDVSVDPIYSSMEFSYIVTCYYYDEDFGLMDVYESERTYFSFNESGTVAGDAHIVADIPLTFDNYNFKTIYMQPFVTIYGDSHIPWYVGCTGLNISVFFDENLRERIKDYDRYYESDVFGVLHDNVRELYERLLEDGQIRENQKQFVTAIGVFFQTRDPVMPDDLISDPENFGDMYSSASGLLLSFSAALAAFSALFTLFVNLPLVNSIIQLSLVFGFIVLLYNISTSGSSHEKRKKDKDKSKDS